MLSKKFIFLSLLLLTLVLSAGIGAGTYAVFMDSDEELNTISTGEVDIELNACTTGECATNIYQPAGTYLAYPGSYWYQNAVIANNEGTLPFDYTIKFVPQAGSEDALLYNGAEDDSDGINLPNDYNQVEVSIFVQDLSGPGGLTEILTWTKINEVEANFVARTLLENQCETLQFKYRLPYAAGNDYENLTLDFDIVFDAVQSNVLPTY